LRVTRAPSIRRRQNFVLDGKHRLSLIEIGNLVSFPTVGYWRDEQTSEDGAGAAPTSPAAPGRASLVARYPALARTLPANTSGDPPTIHDAATAAVEHKG